MFSEKATISGYQLAAIREALVEAHGVNGFTKSVMFFSFDKEDANKMNEILLHFENECNDFSFHKLEKEFFDKMKIDSYGVAKMIEFLHDSPAHKEKCAYIFREYVNNKFSSFRYQIQSDYDSDEPDEMEELLEFEIIERLKNKYYR